MAWMSWSSWSILESTVATLSRTLSAFAPSRSSWSALVRASSLSLSFLMSSAVWPAAGDTRTAAANRAGRNRVSVMEGVSGW